MIVLYVFLWWISGFLAGLWALDASNRNIARRYPASREYITWGNILFMAIVSVVGGALLALSSIIVAIIWECGERKGENEPTVLQLLNRPVWKKDKAA